MDRTIAELVQIGLVMVPKDSADRNKSLSAAAAARSARAAKLNIARTSYEHGNSSWKVGQSTYGTEFFFPAIHCAVLCRNVVLF